MNEKYLTGVVLDSSLSENGLCNYNIDNRLTKTNKQTKYISAIHLLGKLLFYKTVNAHFIFNAFIFNAFQVWAFIL